MGQAGRILTRVQLLGQPEERPRVAGEVGHVKHCCRVREVILLKVIIETSSWGPFERRTDKVPGTCSMLRFAHFNSMPVTDLGSCIEEGRASI